ncbi:hypothetical protein CQ14_41115 [Bradyrhizobium lablabi]|uniref:Uncharacterized protein n=1 Tax=Bradyrhizobium lablabi TaxID=722472 RepID=A0A0R3NFF3_9BRAD|nr:hypothetical protein CQ14_41115 [Bradyrhizobium lablabi]
MVNRHPQRIRKHRSDIIEAWRRQQPVGSLLRYFVIVQHFEAADASDRHGAAPDSLMVHGFCF